MWRPPAVTGAVVSEGFIHSCLATAASLAAGVVRLIRALIAAAPVAGFDETTLRSGPAGDKKYVHGAFTEEYSAFWLGARSLDSMHEAGVLPGRSAPRPRPGASVIPRDVLRRGGSRRAAGVRRDRVATC
jgi:Transposase IS66 family